MCSALSVLTRKQSHSCTRSTQKRLESARTNNKWLLVLQFSEAHFASNPTPKPETSKASTTTTRHLLRNNCGDGGASSFSACSCNGLQGACSVRSLVIKVLAILAANIYKSKAVSTEQPRKNLCPPQKTLGDLPLYANDRILCSFDEALARFVAVPRSCGQ